MLIRGLARLGAGLILSLNALRSAFGADGYCWVYTIDDLCERQPATFETGFNAAGQILPGGMAAFSLADGRFTVSVEQLQGADLYASDRVARAHHLAEDDNWRRTVSLGYQVLRSNLISVDLNAGFSDLDLPYTRGQSMNIGAFSAWEHNRVADTSVDIRLLDGRVAIQSNYFWSAYSMEVHDEGPPGLSESSKSGIAQWHNFQADLLRSEGASLSVYGLYHDVDPEFVSLRDRRVSVYSADGEKTWLGGQSVSTTDRASAREKAKSFKTGTYWEPGREDIEGTFRELGGVFGIGRLELSGRTNWLTEYQSDGHIGNQDESQVRAKYRLSPVTLTGWTQRKTIADKSSNKLGAQIVLALGQAFELLYDTASNPLAILLPTDISVYGSLQQDDFVQAATSDRINRELGVGLDWESENSVTNISVSGQFSESGSPTTDPTNDVSLDFSHTIFYDTWDLTAYGAVNRVGYQEGGAAHDLYLGAGLSLWLSFAHFPDVVAALDFNAFSSESAGSASLYRDWYAKLSLDFSKYLAAMTTDRNAFARITYRVQNVTTAETGAAPERKSDHAAIVSYAQRF